MRGLLGSLICANSARTETKALPLFAFYRAPTHTPTMHAQCQSARAWQEMHLSFQLTLGKVFIAWVEVVPAGAGPVVSATSYPIG